MCGNLKQAFLGCVMATFTILQSLQFKTTSSIEVAANITSLKSMKYIYIANNYKYKAHNLNIPTPIGVIIALITQYSRINLYFLGS